MNDSDSDSSSTTPVLPTSNLAPSSPVPAPNVDMSDATDLEARMSSMEGILQNIQAFIANQPQNPASPSAPSLAAPAPDPGPALFATPIAGTKSVLRPNPPFVFDGDRTQGRAFLHAVRSYAALIPEAFAVNGVGSEERVIRYALSFMAKDAAQTWSERHSGKTPFPFPTWDLFVAEFKLRFVQENEQDHALLRLESKAYHMGARDVFKYTDEFEDLVDLAGFDDQIIKVAKYRTGLDPAINVAITGSGDLPALADYPAWRRRAYRQYESQVSARNRAPGNSARAPAPIGRSTFAAARLLFPLVRGPGAAMAPQPRTSAPALPPPVPMDVDRARARGAPRRGCFRCGDPNHFARDCTAPVDVRSIDVLDEVVQQLDGPLLEELLARLASAEVVAEHTAAAAQPTKLPLLPKIAMTSSAKTHFAQVRLRHAAQPRLRF